MVSVVGIGNRLAAGAKCGCRNPECWPFSAGRRSAAGVFRCASTCRLWSGQKAGHWANQPKRAFKTSDNFNTKMFAKCNNNQLTPKTKRAIKILMIAECVRTSCRKRVCWSGRTCRNKTDRWSLHNWRRGIKIDRVQASQLSVSTLQRESVKQKLKRVNERRRRKQKRRWDGWLADLHFPIRYILYTAKSRTRSSHSSGKKKKILLGKNFSLFSSGRKFLNSFWFVMPARSISARPQNKKMALG